MLLVPSTPAPYDRRMMADFAAGFVALGHPSLALERPLADAELVRICADFRADAVLRVNCLPPAAPPLPASIRYIGWFQDVFVHTARGPSHTLRQSDVIYALGQGVSSALGELPCRRGFLYSGVNPDDIGPIGSAAEQALDFSLCGFIPRPLSRRNWWRQVAISLGNRVLDVLLPPCFDIPFPVPSPLREDLIEDVERNYRPLCGLLDIHALASSLEKLSSRYVESGGPFFAPRMGRWRRRSRLDAYINFLARDYPRYLERELMLRKALEVSTSLEVHGPLAQGLADHAWLRPYLRPPIADRAGIIALYRRTRLNLANNTDGLGLHSRTLECMAAGGFIFMHHSSRDEEPGGMLTAFEPGVHYGRYLPDAFEEEARRWLCDTPRRLAVGRRAAELVRTQHTWVKRAEQVLGDLRQ
jgi:hypothetical protein